MRRYGLAVLLLTLFASTVSVAFGASSTRSAMRLATAEHSLGIVTFSSSDVLTNRFLDAVSEGMKKQGWTVSSVDANGSTANANAAMKALVQKKVSAILVTVFPPSELGAGLQATRSAGIPVVDAGGGLGNGVALAIDTGIPDPMVKYMLKQIGTKNAAVLNLTYHPGLPCRERADAMDAAAKAHKGIKLTDHEITIPGAAQSAQSATAGWLAANPASAGKHLAIFNCYDDDAMGAISALKQAHRSDVKVYSFNGTPPALQAIRSGSMTATLWLNLVASSSTIIADLPKIISQGKAWKPVMVPSPYVIVDKSNLATFLKQNPGAGKG